MFFFFFLVSGLDIMLVILTLAWCHLYGFLVVASVFTKTTQVGGGGIMCSDFNNAPHFLLEPIVPQNETTNMFIKL